jgi:hypothetical protein
MPNDFALTDVPTDDVGDKIDKAMVDPLPMKVELERQPNGKWTIRVRYS